MPKKVASKGKASKGERKTGKVQSLVGPKDPPKTLREVCILKLFERTGRLWTDAFACEVKEAIKSRLDEASSHAAESKSAAKLLEAMREAVQLAHEPPGDQFYRKFVREYVEPVFHRISDDLAMMARGVVPEAHHQRVRLVQLFDAPSERGGFLKCGREATPIDLAYLSVLADETRGQDPDEPEKIKEGIRLERDRMTKARLRHGLPVFRAIEPPGPPDRLRDGIRWEWRGDPPTRRFIIERVELSDEERAAALAALSADLRRLAYLECLHRFKSDI